MQRATLSAIRYGYGLGPGVTPPETPDALLATAGKTANRAARAALSDRVRLFLDYREARKTDDEEAQMAAQRKVFQTAGDDLRHYLGEAVAEGGFGERLLAFWADHFTVAANGPQLRILVPDFIDTAIRPHIAERFPDLLTAATLHPAMLIYLNQVQSVGPNSRAGKRRGRGLNENLAREILELHTLGVGAGYDQDDVRSFARLLTGLSADKGGFKYRQAISEPGPHLVLGKGYGGPTTRLDSIKAALKDIALRPETAAHLARKLQTHFIGQVDAELTDAMANRFLATGGDLAATYKVMLDDDRAWAPALMKAKTPFEFIVSAMRAAGADKTDIDRMKRKELRDGVVSATQAMGQTLFRPPGPDGWSEDASAWITPPGLAARIRWSVGFAERIQGSQDPRLFLKHALADAATPLLTRAVRGAESRSEGLAITLVSPEFNRR